MISAPHPPGQVPVAVVFDMSALLALGAGHQLASRLVVAAHCQPHRRVLAPALCLAAAASQRPALADHVGSLIAIDVLELGFAGASQTGAVIAAGADWRLAHAIMAASPSLEWPAGLPVVTNQPEAYQQLGLRTLTLD